MDDAMRNVKLFDSSKELKHSRRERLSERLYWSGVAGMPLTILPMLSLEKAGSLDPSGVVAGITLGLFATATAAAGLVVGMTSPEPEPVVVPASSAELLARARREAKTLRELSELGLPTEFLETARSLMRSLDTTTKAVSETVTPALTAMRLGVVTASQAEAVKALEELLSRDLQALERLNATAREYLAVLLEDGSRPEQHDMVQELREERLAALEASTAALREMRAGARSLAQ